MILIVSNYTENHHLGDYQMKAMGEYIKGISGLACMNKRYYEVNGQFLKENPQIKGIILGGCNCCWDHLYFDIFEGEFELIREAKVPVLGICAGHHLMAMAYGAGVRRADFGKEERFFTDMKIEKESALTEGVENPYVFEFHNCAVMELPEGFELLMSSAKTKIQAMKKIDEDKFGVQFHPELDSEATDPMFRARDPKEVNGEKILINFLELTKKQ